MRVELVPGYEISRLIHGGWQFSDGHRLRGDGWTDAVDLLEASAEVGVTTFDCADIYTGVEELFGRFLRRWSSSSAQTPIQIHTKFVPDDAVLDRVDRSYVRRIIHRSLSRLGLERVDLVQFYWWRDEVPGMEEAAGYLAELCEEGKIGRLGVTNFSTDRVRRLTEAGVPVVSNQVQFSLLDRRPMRSLQEFSSAHDIGILAFGALAGGFLTNRWVGRPVPDAVETRSQTKYRLIIEECGGWEKYQRLLRVLVDVAQRHNVAASAVALHWVLTQRSVSAAICGATKPGQMARNVEAVSLDLASEDEAAIADALEGLEIPPGAIFALERDRDGPHGRIMRYDLNRT